MDELHSVKVRILECVTFSLQRKPKKKLSKLLQKIKTVKTQNEKIFGFRTFLIRAPPQTIIFFPVFTF